MRLILKHFITVLKRFKASSILNIAGLSVAFAVFYVITVQVYHDFSFDRNFEKADNIYYISKFVDINGERWTTTNTRTPKEIAQIFPEVKNYCFMMVEPNYTFDVPDDTENRREFAEIATFASEGFVDIFTPEVISGDVRRAFNTDWQGMLTESVAKKFFGDEDPLGKVFYFHNENNPIRVVAVCKDFPDNCSIKNGVFLNKHEGNDAEAAYTSYLEIIPGGKDKVLNTINNSRDEDNGNWKIVEPTEALELTALPDIHLKFPVKGSGSLSSTLSLMAIGIILLIIAYINFVNFSIAMAPVRLKGFNIRRILGENPLFLKFSIAIEAALFSFIAFLISIPIVTYLNNGIISDFFQADLLFSKNIGLLLLIGGISLATGFIAGIYPAFYSTAFSPAMALKGASVASHHSRILKNSLIVIQFVATICLVVVSVFIKIQHDYMQNKSWNIKTENVIYFPLWKINNLSNFRDELEKNPDIYGFTFSTYHPGNEGMGWGRTFENTEVKLTSWPVYYNYAEFFDVKIIAGRDFVREDMTGSGKIIFNQAFIKKYRLDKNIIGQEFFGFDMCEIIGIMEDFNFESLKEPIKPMAFVTGRDYANWIRTTFIRINGDNTPKTLAYIRDSWKQFSTEPVDINFLDETINRLYQQESNLAKLILIFGLITIIVSIMGVYGLILFDAKSKRKTIALHKVHGASKSEVILMLNRNLIIQFVIAYIIAVPLAYYVVNSWLEGFAYKTPIHWWVFILGGLIVFMISLATVSWQSYRAASINPVEAIKSE